MRTPTPTPSRSRHQAERGLITSAGRGGFWLKISLASCKVPPASLSLCLVLHGTGPGRTSSLSVCCPSFLLLVLPTLSLSPFIVSSLPLLALPSKAEKYKVMEVHFRNYFGLVTYELRLDPSTPRIAYTHPHTLLLRAQSRTSFNKLVREKKEVRQRDVTFRSYYYMTMYFLLVLIRVIFRILTFVANITLVIYLCFRPEQSPLIPS